MTLMGYTMRLVRWQPLPGSRIPSVLLVAVFLYLLLPGCQKERNEFGIEFIPEGERQAVVTEGVDALNISTKVVKSDAGRVRSFSSFSLGEMNDATYGRTACALYSEFFPTATDLEGFTSAMEAESAKLQLRVSGHYGSSQLKLSIYEATSATQKDVDSKIENVPHGNLLGDVIVDGSTETVELVLSKELGTRLARNLVENAYSVEKFRSVFQGIYITAKRINSTDEGMMLFFNSSDANTGIFVSWKNEKGESKLLKMPMYSNGYRYLSIEHDFTGALVGASVEKSSAEQDQSGVGYLVGDGGTAIVVNFSRFYDEWKSKGTIAIQRAQLLIPLDEGSVLGGDTVTYGLASYTLNGEEYSVVVDETLSTSAYGGLYDYKQKCYVLNITSYVQHLLNERGYPSELYILPASVYFGISRLTVATCHNLKRPAHLVVTYTKL